MIFFFFCKFLTGKFFFTLLSYSSRKHRAACLVDTGYFHLQQVKVSWQQWTTKAIWNYSNLTVRIKYLLNIRKFYIKFYFNVILVEISRNIVLLFSVTLYNSNFLTNRQRSVVVLRIRLVVFVFFAHLVTCWYIVNLYMCECDSAAWCLLIAVIDNRCIM